MTPLRLCLVTDAAPVQAAVRVSMLPPNEVDIFPLTGFLDDQQGVSAQGRAALKAAKRADLVLINWQMAQAALLNTLCYHIRTRDEVPVMALCSGSQEEMIAALSTGVDDVLTLPLYLPLVQAKVAAHRRLIASVQRSAARKVKKKLKKRLEKRSQALLAESIDHTEGQLEARIETTLASHPGDGSVHPAAMVVIEEVVENVLKEVSLGLADGLAERVTDQVDKVLDPAFSETTLTLGALRLDPQSFRFFVDTIEVELTPKEFGLLEYLMRHPGTTCTRDQILDAVWGIDFDTGTNMVDVYMHFVRRKLEAHGLKGLIQTIRGRGYRLDPPMPQASVA